MTTRASTFIMQRIASGQDDELVEAGVRECIAGKLQLKFTKVGVRCVHCHACVPCQVGVAGRCMQDGKTVAHCEQQKTDAVNTW
jgi:hypothetical protein